MASRRDPELKEQGKCNYYQVKGQEYKEQKNPGVTAHPNSKYRMGFYMKEQTEKEQEIDIDPATNHRPLEEEQQEQDVPVKHPILQNLVMDKENQKIPGPVDTFNPQELRDTPRTSKQRSQPAQESEDLELEQESRSSQEMYLTEDSRDPELKEQSKCNYYWVKGQEYKEQRNTVVTAHPNSKYRRGFYMDEQTEKEQEMEIDPITNPRPPEE